MGQSKTGARFCNEDVKVVDVTEKAKKASLVEQVWTFHRKRRRRAYQRSVCLLNEREREETAAC